MEGAADYEIVYESPAQRMQRSEELVGIQRTMEMAMPFIETDPSIIQMFNADEIIRLSADINGAPVSILKTPDQMEELRAQQAQQAQQQQQMEMISQMAPAAKDLSQVELPAEAGLA